MAGIYSVTTRALSVEEERATSILRAPETPEEWEAEYERRRAVMHGEPYTLSEILAYGIFRAVEESGGLVSEQSKALREADDERFVQGVNASALFRGVPQLELTDEAVGNIDAAAAVWTRSKVPASSGHWAALLSGLGELGLESVKFGDGVRVVAYDPATVFPVFDAETSTRLVSVTIIAPYVDPDDTDDFGHPTGPAALHSYKRVIDEKEVNVWVNGEHQPKISGPHNAGRIPFAWLRWSPMPSDPAHGLPSSHGMGARVARMDSIDAQIDAVGKRYANPLLTVKGAKLSDPDVLKLGKTLSGIPADGTVEYIEPTMQGAATLAAIRAAKHAALKESRPEYIFDGAGAAASGAALTIRASQLISAVQDVRSRVFAGLASVTEAAVAMEGEGAEAGWLSVSAAPVIPPDRASEMEALVKADGLGLQGADVVKALQRLGYIDPEANAEDYAADAADRAALKATTFFRG